MQLRDPAEQSLRGAGLIRAREAETGREVVTIGRAAGVNMDQSIRELHRAGVDHLLIDIDRPYVQTVRQFFRGRNLLGRGVR